MSTLHETLTRHLDDLEALARDAARPGSGRLPAPDNLGLHWQWVSNESDTALSPEVVLGLPDSRPDEDHMVGLRSVEEFGEQGDNPWERPLPHFVLGYVECDSVVPAAMLLITRNAPGATLARVEADRRVLKRHGRSSAVVSFDPAGDTPPRFMCQHDGWAYPCPDVLDVAARLGVEVPS